MLFPEGGRSPGRLGPAVQGRRGVPLDAPAPVVPVFIEGTGSILGKGMKWPKPGRTTVTFGSPLWPEDGESTRRYNERIEHAVTVLGDETLTDWWSARQRSACAASPAPTGPSTRGWRRAWALSEPAQHGRPAPPPEAPLAQDWIDRLTGLARPRLAVAPRSFMAGLGRHRPADP